MSASDENDGKKRSKNSTRKSKSSKDQKESEAKLLNDLTSMGLKLVPVEKSTSVRKEKINAKNNNRKVATEIRKTCGGKVMPSRKELVAMYEDEVDENKSCNGIIETQTTCDSSKVIDAGSQGEASDDNIVDDFFGTDALNREPDEDPSPRDQLPCVYRFLNPRGEPLPESNKKKKCNVGKPSSRGGVRTRRLPCTCDDGKPCRKRGHRRKSRNSKDNIIIIPDSVTGIKLPLNISNEIVSLLDDLQETFQSTSTDLPKINRDIIDLDLYSDLRDTNESGFQNNFDQKHNLLSNLNKGMSKTSIILNSSTDPISSNAHQSTIIDNKSKILIKSIDEVTYAESLSLEEIRDGGLGINTTINQNVKNNCASREFEIAQNFTSVYRSFSPLPSTSYNKAVCEINDQKFINSLEINKPLLIEEEVNIENKRKQKEGKENCEIKEINIENYIVNVQDEVDESDNDNTLKERREETEITAKEEILDICKSESRDSNELEISKEESTEVVSVDTLLDMISVEDSNDSPDCEAIDVDTLLSENTFILNQYKGTNDANNDTDTDVVIVDDLNCNEDLSESVVNVTDSLEPTNNNSSDGQLENLSFAGMLKNLVSGLCNSPKTISAMSLFALNPAAYVKKHFQALKEPQQNTSQLDESLRLTGSVSCTNVNRNKRKQPGKTMNYGKKSKIIDTIDLVNCDFIGSRDITMHPVVTIDLETSYNQSSVNCVCSGTPSTQTPSTLSQVTSLQDTVTTSVSPLKSGPYGDCPICLENFASTSMASTLCGHLFCLPCLKEVSKTSKKCPTCRKAIKKNGYHQIYL